MTDEIHALCLRDLPRDQPAIVTGFQAGDSDLEIRLREIGFAEGDTVQTMHFGLFGRNPMTVRLNGALIAMRKAEAAAVLVTQITGERT